ncbi:hypothetical protein [Paenibacillus xylanexedens]|uniref:hypothetical protein n=1 Tax=Paenibacillus xylanexedens TaxID=528191 RepID=UPI000F5403FB|nr:hypothetical protein [Paenibacillus xylanexedens]
MSFLVRKVTKSKWPNSDADVDIANVSADAVSSCLRTSQNKLSTWEIESLDKIEDAVLALISNADRIENMDVITIEKDNIRGLGFILDEQTPGKTVVDDLKDTHIDICELNYKTIGEFAAVIVSAFKEERHLRFTRRAIEGIVKKAISDGRVDQAKLKFNL